LSRFRGGSLPFGFLLFLRKTVDGLAGRIKVLAPGSGGTIDQGGGVSAPPDPSAFDRHVLLQGRRGDVAMGTAFHDAV
jgi:hypothetical protein